MKKYKEILNAFIERVREKEGSVDPALKLCAGRAQLLAHIKGNISDYYRSGAIDTALLREMFEEKELNRQGIYTTGSVQHNNFGKDITVAGDCECDVSAGTVRAFDDAKVIASYLSKVYAYDKVTVVANMRAVVSARDNCQVVAGDFAAVKVFDDVTVDATDRTNVTVHGSATVTAGGDAYVRVMGNMATVRAYSFATVHHDGTENVTVEGCAVAINTKTYEVKHGSALVIKQEK